MNSRSHDFVIQNKKSALSCDKKYHGYLQETSQILGNSDFEQIFLDNFFTISLSSTTHLLHCNYEQQIITD